MKINGHNFVLMSDKILEKEYLCLNCRAKATFNIYPRNSIVSDVKKHTITGNCYKEKVCE